VRRLPLALLLGSAVALTACADAPAAPAAAVTRAEATTAVQRLVELASERTTAAMQQLCAAEQCRFLSSVLPYEPELAPARDAAPREVCSVGLPPTGDQAGARLVVLQGTRGDGESYVSQVLLERVDDAVVAHEPGFWLGIRYTALQAGRAWSGQGDVPAARAADQASALRACSDTAEWLAEVTGA